MQIVVNGLIATSIYLIVAIGIAMIYRVAGFFNFAHGMLVTAGAYIAYLIKMLLGGQTIVYIITAIILVVILGITLEALIYRQLRGKDASALVVLLASLGIYVVLQNVISLIFGNDTKMLRDGTVKEGVRILGARITMNQMIMIIISIVLVVIVNIIIKRTKYGMTMRAVANDDELAKVSGIDSDRIVLWTFAIASALAGIAGIIIAFDVDVTPNMGMNPLLMGIVVVIIGGGGSISGMVLGALLLGLAQNLGVWFINSQWQDAIAFVILLAFLLTRPEGIMGKKLKKATV